MSRIPSPPDYRDTSHLTYPKNPESYSNPKTLNLSPSTLKPQPEARNPQLYLHRIFTKHLTHSQELLLKIYATSPTPSPSDYRGTLCMKKRKQNSNDLLCFGIFILLHNTHILKVHNLTYSRNIFLSDLPARCVGRRGGCWEILFSSCPCGPACRQVVLAEHLFRGLLGITSLLMPCK
jgi:hypothetical protein